MNSKGGSSRRNQVLAAGPAGGGRCALPVANTGTCRQFRRGDLQCSCGPCAGLHEMTSRFSATC